EFLSRGAEFRGAIRNQRIPTGIGRLGAHGNSRRSCYAEQQEGICDVRDLRTEYADHASLHQPEGQRAAGWDGLRTIWGCGRRGHEGRIRALQRVWRRCGSEPRPNLEGREVLFGKNLSQARWDQIRHAGASFSSRGKTACGEGYCLKEALKARTCKEPFSVILLSRAQPTLSPGAHASAVLIPPNSRAANVEERRNGVAGPAAISAWVAGLSVLAIAIHVIFDG